MKEIYLIEKTWIDNLENREPWGYEPVGFVETEEEAKKIVEEGGKHEDQDCWAWGSADFPAPTKFRYKKINKHKKQ